VPLADRPRNRQIWRLLNDAGARKGILQLLLLLALTSAAWYFWTNAVANLTARHMVSGFGFLSSPAGFDIEERLIQWDPSDTNARAILVGLINTLGTTAVCIILGSMIGLALALMRLSRNALYRFTSKALIEFFRNIPQLLVILFIYFAVLQSLPSMTHSVTIGDAVFLNVRGLYLPALALPSDPRGLYEFPLIVAFISGAALSIGKLLPRWVPKSQRFRVIRVLKNIPWQVGTLCLSTMVILVALAELTPIYPKLQGFNYVGGMRIFPEFLALATGLTITGSVYIAEIIRAGVLSVPAGQAEAARSLGLTRWQINRLVVFPQALRVIIPPLSSQYMNIAKSTTLGVAIAYADLVQIFVGTVLNHTGQEIEIMFITLCIYLAINLFISTAMNILNNKTRLVER